MFVVYPVVYRICGYRHTSPRVRFFEPSSSTELVLPSFDRIASVERTVIAIVLVVVVAATILTNDGILEGDTEKGSGAKVSFVDCALVVSICARQLGYETRVHSESASRERGAHGSERLVHKLAVVGVAPSRMIGGDLDVGPRPCGCAGKAAVAVCHVQVQDLAA